MPRPSTRDLRRAELLAAFRRVLAREGYDGTTTAAIGAEAGLAPGLVHYHFADKEALLLALTEQLGAETLARLPDAGPPAERLFAALDHLLGLGAHADPVALACHVVILAEALRRPSVRVAHAAGVHQLSSWFTQRFVEIGHPHPADAAASLIVLIEGLYVMHSTVPGLVAAGSGVTTAHAWVHHLLAQTGAEHA